MQEQAQTLQRLLDKHAVPLDMSCGASAASAEDIITYAHKLCYTTFAPPSYQAGVTVLHNFRPPVPQEWQLRASQLHVHSSKPPNTSCRAITHACVRAAIFELC